MTISTTTPTNEREAVKGKKGKGTLLPAP